MSNDKPRLRIAFIDYVLEPDKPGRSGLSDVVWDMAGELSRLGHEAHIIGAYRTTTYPISGVIVHNFTPPPGGYRNLLGQLWLLHRAARIAQQIKPDLIHTPEYISTALLATLGISVPVVLTVPGNIFQRIKQGHSFEWHFVQVLKWAARLSARKCARIIAISREMQRWWLATGAVNNTILIPYGINFERFYPVPDARTRLGLPNEMRLFLYVGRFSPEKGLFNLLEAFRSVRMEGEAQKIHLLLVGKGPLQQEIATFIHDHQLAHLITTKAWVSQEELKFYYSAAELLLMPSWNEPLGKVMLEAMACGTPVLASATEGPLDHIKHGNNGFLFRPHQEAELVALLQQVIYQPQMVIEMGRNAYTYVRSHLSWRQMTQRIVDEVYYPIVAQPYPSAEWAKVG